MTTLPHSGLLQLKRWNTPTLYNGWEQITRHEAGADGFNREEIRDVDEMCNAGFKALARRFCVGHAYS